MVVVGTANYGKLATGCANWPQSYSQQYDVGWLELILLVDILFSALLLASSDRRVRPYRAAGLDVHYFHTKGTDNDASVFY